MFRFICTKLEYFYFLLRYSSSQLQFEVQILDASHVYAALELNSAFINIDWNIDIDINKATIWHFVILKCTVKLNASFPPSSPVHRSISPPSFLTATRIWTRSSCWRRRTWTSWTSETPSTEPCCSLLWSCCRSMTVGQVTISPEHRISVITSYMF